MIEIDDLAMNLSKVLLLADTNELILTENIGYLKYELKKEMKTYLKACTRARSVLEKYASPEAQLQMGIDSDKLIQIIDKL